MTADPSWWMVALQWLPAFSAFVSAVALVMTVVNLGVYRRTAPRAAASASKGAPDAGPVLTVCIPARNEERNVEAVVRGALANADVPLEVLVYDDQSTDRTPAILAALRGEDARVRVVVVVVVRGHRVGAAALPFAIAAPVPVVLAAAGAVGVPVPPRAEVRGPREGEGGRVHEQLVETAGLFCA